MVTSQNQYSPDGEPEILVSIQTGNILWKIFAPDCSLFSLKYEVTESGTESLVTIKDGDGKQCEFYFNHKGELGTDAKISPYEHPEFSSLSNILYTFLVFEGIALLPPIYMTVTYEELTPQAQ